MLSRIAVQIVTKRFLSIRCKERSAPIPDDLEDFTRGYNYNATVDFSKKLSHQKEMEGEHEGFKSKIMKLEAEDGEQKSKIVQYLRKKYDKSEMITTPPEKSEIKKLSHQTVPTPQKKAPLFANRNKRGRLFNKSNGKKTQLTVCQE